MAEKKYTRIVVEENNEHGFDSYRVPGIVTASNGDLLLTYEGRKDGGNSRTLFLRRYRMIDETIEPIGERVTMVSPKDDELIHNPLLIAAPEGKIYFFWCQDYKRLFLKESDDNGVSFGTERELTSLIDGFRKEWPVTLWAIAPGHGISKKDGTLILPLWLSRGENAHLPACFACLFSQDQGKTWRCSSVVPAGNGVGDPTESSVAERSDGTLLATMRHEIPGVRRRAFCESKKEIDGEDTIRWGEPWLNQELPDPICGGALLSLSDGKMAFVNCAYGDEPALERQKQGESVRWSLDARQKLTIRLSKDDGVTWNDGLMIAEEGGASDLAGKDAIACFYEEGWQDGNCIFNQRLSLAVIPWVLL